MKLAARARQFAHILDEAPRGLEILSLDCFDTLLWRNCNQPIDVFTDLPMSAAGVETRIWGEAKARRMTPLQHGRNEVTIEEIYAHLSPTASESERAALIAQELDAEARYCFAFEPTVALMKAAKARGLKIVLVSDTYLSEPQLRALIGRAAGAEILAMIDRIFVSSAYGCPKVAGLFMHVLAELNVSPGAILHCGDNPLADVAAAEALGIHCCHLEQFDEESDRRLRMEAIAATIVDPRTRISLPAWQPHRPQIALRPDDEPVTKLGHDVLGPVFHAFSGWVHDEAAAQEARTGKPTKLLFLMRDGYLPAQAYLARYPEAAPQVAMVEISRLTAAQAGLTDKAALMNHVQFELTSGSNTGSCDIIARHLLFDPAETERLGKLSWADFTAHVGQDEVAEGIVARSRAFATKLMNHLRRHGIEDGDSVMLVDLGYNGSVQNLIEPLLRDRMNLEVSGRYLLLRETWMSGLDKAGFADKSQFDLRAVQTLCDFIIFVEQLCTIAQGAVIDYEPDGRPIHENRSLKAAQSRTREAVQAACLDYIRDADKGIAAPAANDTPETRRRMAVAVLARLLFFPTPSEIAVLHDFDHDINFGGDDILKFFDAQAAEDGLRRWGLFYIKNGLRPYLPGELRAHGLPLSLSLFMARRFNFDLRKTDFDVGAISVPVMLMAANGEHLTLDIDAYPTIDGYYQMLIPVGAGAFTAGVQLGRIADWAQLGEASFHPVDGFLDAKAQEDALPATLLPQGFDDMGAGLMRAEAGDAAFVLVPPTASAEPLLLSFVFRPVVAKGQAEQSVRAAA